MLALNKVPTEIIQEEEINGSCH